MRKIIAIAALVALSGCSSNPCESDVEAFTMAAQMIEKQTGPSAKVASITDSTRTPITLQDGRCAFVISGKIDGQNVFGGPVRKYFRATLIPDAKGREWTMENLSIY